MTNKAQHLFYTRKKYPEIYDFLLEKGNGDLEKGLRLYRDEIFELRTRLGYVHLELTTCSSMTRYFRETKENKEFKTASSMMNYFSSTPYVEGVKIMSLKTFNKSLRIIKAYEAWKGAGYSNKQKNKIKDLYK